MLYSFSQPEIQTNLIKNHHSTHQPIYCLHPSSFCITFEELHFWQGVCALSERSSWDRDRLYAMGVQANNHLVRLCFGSQHFLAQCGGVCPDQTYRRLEISTEEKQRLCSYCHRMGGSSVHCRAVVGSPGCNRRRLVLDFLHLWVVDVGFRQGTCLYQHIYKQYSLHKNSEVFVQEIKRDQQELSLQQNHHFEDG